MLRYGRVFANCNHVLAGKKLGTNVGLFWSNKFDASRRGNKELAYSRD